MYKSKNLSSLFVFSLVLSGSAFAAAPPAYHHNVVMPVPAGSPDRFELLGGVGVAQMDLGNGELGVTSSETDRLVQSKSDGLHTFAAQGGFGYLHYFGNALRYSEHTQWFPAIEPELNVYYLGLNDINGDVWRFGSANFNDMTYSMPVDSTRLMFDTALTIVSKKRASWYVIGGVGNAWNHFGYSDTDKDNSCPDQVLVLNSTTHSNFAWEAGTGLSFVVDKRSSLFIEYLYADLGTGHTSINGTTGTITTPIITAANFDVAAQTGLIGIHIAI